MALPKKKAESRKPADKVRSVSHIGESLKSNIGNAKRHIVAGGDTFNRQHAAKHLGEAKSDAGKLVKAINAVPAVRKETQKLNQAKGMTPRRKGK